jgi:hypothetical protein
VSKSSSSKHGNDGIIFNFVKFLLKIYFEHDNWLLGFMPDIHIFKSISKTILDNFSLNEAILICMNNGDDFLLKSSGH